MKTSNLHILILIILLILLKPIEAQFYQFQKVFIPMPQYMDSLNYQFNFYDLHDNPASLFEDESKKSIWMGAVSNHLSGDYHLPFDPQEINSYNYFARTIYPLSENDIFKGTFTYRHQNDKQVLWMHQNRRLEENPYLLADSTSGDFVLNGILWSAEWAHRYKNRILFGLGVIYNVDQRLKQVFPKPLNKHRDMIFKSGLQFSLDKWKIGLSYHYIDEQEKVEIRKYNLEQNLTPTLFKFRFSDLPVILRGRTSEERVTTYQAHAIGFELSKKITFFNLITHMRYISAKSNTMDGGTRAQNEGSYDKNEFLGALKISYNLIKTKYFISYNYYNRFLSAYHPDFGFTTIKHPRYEHHFIAGMQNRLSSDLHIYADFLFSIYNEQKKDLFINNYWLNSYKMYGLRVGGSYFWTRFWETDLWLNYAIFDYSEKERSNNQYTPFFKYLFSDPFSYYTEKNRDLLGGFKVVYHYLPLLEIELATYIKKEIPGQYLLSNSKRLTLNFSLILKVFIF